MEAKMGAIRRGPLAAKVLRISTAALTAGASIIAAPAAAGAAPLIETELVIQASENGFPGFPPGTEAYYLTAANGQPLDDGSVTGTVESRVANPFLTKLGRDGYDTEPRPISPYYGGPLAPAPTVYQELARDLGIFGTWTQTVTYSGDDIYAGTERIDPFAVTAPDGVAVTDILLTTSPAVGGQTAVTAVIEPGANGILMFNCATKQQIADKEALEYQTLGSAGTSSATCNTPDAGPYVLIAHFLSTTPGYSNLLTAMQFNTGEQSSNAKSNSLPVATQGQTVHATFANAEPNTTYEVELASTPRSLGTFTSANDGALEFDFTVPSDLGDGVHHLNLLRDGTRAASIEFQVLYLDDGAATTLAGEIDGSPGDGGDDDDSPDPGTGGPNTGSLTSLLGSLGS